MPYKAPTVCIRCNQGPCQCKPEDKTAARQRSRAKRDERNSNARGYNYAWRKASKTFLIVNPLCVVCRAKGLTMQAQVVDHIKPHRGDAQLFWDEDNWQGLCIQCHNEKSARGE